MKKAEYQRELVYICALLPSHEERKALTRHLVHLNKEIIDCEARDEPTQVMRLTYDCLDKTLELLDAIRDIKIAINGGK